MSSSSSSPNKSSSAPQNRLVYGADDALFGWIEEQQGKAPFGRVLDAGTGLHSLRWIATLKESKGMTHFTAITADQTMQRNVQREAEALGMIHEEQRSSSGGGGEVIIGNWFGVGETLIDDQLEKESYDVILADYLIGAMDGFSPFQQDLMIPKLAAYLKPGGRLYIVGLEPIPDSVSDENANVICKVRQVRDACILLAGHRCYREYPVEWIQRHIRQQQEPLLTLDKTSSFPILYKQATIVSQIKVARSKLPHFSSPELATQMKSVLNELEEESLVATQRAGGRIRLGFDYVVSATRTLSPSLPAEPSDSGGNEQSK